MNLVERLLSWTESGSEGDVITQFYIDIHEAADRIEALEAEVDTLKSYFKHPEKYPKCPNCGLNGDLEGHTCIALNEGKDQ